MTRMEFKETGYAMTFEEFKKCDCSKCKEKECKHRGAFRRLPVVDGGLGLCQNLNKK